jgi:hypothetical protein
MSARDPSGLELHTQPDFFAEAIRFTATRTGFLARLIEKDYFCTVALACLARADPALVFKGGTCLAKVHAGFHRMSEDLDFTISMGSDAGRSQRSRSSARIKAAFARIPDELPCFRLTQPMTGANESKQYVGTLTYGSLFSDAPETIQVEIGIREPVVTPIHLGRAGTVLLDPVSKRPLIEGVTVPCLSMSEALAEKLRAALTRREAAIRDFFDLDHAVRELGLRPEEDEFLDILRRKLAVPGTGAVDVSPEKLATLRRQVDAKLRPVVRREDIDAFDLERSFRVARDLAAVLIR